MRHPQLRWEHLISFLTLECPRDRPDYRALHHHREDRSRPPFAKASSFAKATEDRSEGRRDGRGHSNCELRISSFEVERIVTGRSIAHYEITALIGEGGMGEVYRATDSKLDREVALKILPRAFASDPQRMARFQREAKVLASLNHSNIGAIYGLEDSAGSQVLILELIEGDTLAERIARGPISLQEALRIALQIVEALEAAHEKGIIHRDLKPANVKVTDEGQVKVLDFGLAKALVPESKEADLSNSPTMTAAATQMGAIMGTAAYMSPEQARGKPVDKRTDIWAFGVVLWEMLTGRPAFPGETITDVLGAVVHKDPDWSMLPPEMPRLIRRLLVRCLSKDAKQRLHDIADARLEIEDALSEPLQGSQLGVSGRQASKRTLLPWAIAAIASGLAAVLAVVALLGPGEEPASWSEILPPNSTSGITPEPALSLDGTSIVFRARGASGPPTLWLRTTDSPAARELAGTDDATLPFWSPDGRSIGFFDFAEAKLKRIDVSDERVQELADTPNPRGGSWSQSGVIVYAPGDPSALYAVSASGGGDPRPVTELGSEHASHSYPHFLPDGRRFLFLDADKSIRDLGMFGLSVGSLDSFETEQVEGIQSRAEYVNGYLLFGQVSTLMAQRIDLDTLALEGDRIRLAGELGLSFGHTVSYGFSGTEDAVIFAHAGITPATRLVTLDRQGRSLEMPDISGEIYTFALSPDQTRVALEKRSPVANTWDIWIADLADGIPQQLVAGSPWAGTPLWSPLDGEHVLFTDWSGRYSIKDVRNDEVQYIEIEGSSGGWLADWSLDEKHIIFQDTDFTTLSDIMVFSPADGGRPTPYLNSPDYEWEPNLSTDGRWLAYSSDESGGFEVYVQAFPEGGRKKRISDSGGRQPRWRQDGKELYYISGDGSFVAATVAAGASGVEVTNLQPLFRAPRVIREDRPQYAVLDNGARFIFNEIDETVPRFMTVIKNWKSLLDGQ